METAFVERVELKPAVLPFFVEPESYPEDLFAIIYARLKAEDLLADVFYEGVPTVEQFEQLLRHDSLTYLFMDIDTAGYAGVAWLSLVEDGPIKRACANIVFFRQYHVPAITSAFGTMLLSQLFNLVGLDIVWALTPHTNVLSCRYCARLGMDQVATLPGWTTHRGVPCDGTVFMMTKADFNRRLDDVR